MGKKQCECGSYLFYVYNLRDDEITVVCVRQENEGFTNHKSIIKEKEVLDNV